MVLINGAPVIAYTLEQDVDIIRTKVQNEHLLEIVGQKDSLLIAKDNYIVDQEQTIFGLLDTRDAMRSLILEQDKQITDLNQAFKLSEKNSEIYKAEAQLYRRRNTTLWIAGSLVVAGLTVALIAK